MKRWLRVLAFIAGAAVLVVLVRQVGIPAVVRGAQAVGWLLIPIILIHGVVYGLNSVAWWLTLAPEPGCPPFLTIVQISLTGFAINFLTPVVNAGGEPYRIAALARWIGTRRAAGSVLQYGLLHAISSILMWLTAVVLALVIGVAGRGVQVGLGALAVAITGALAVVLTGHRHGFVGKLAGWVGRLRLGRLSEWIHSREEGFRAVDAQITALHRERPGRLGAAVAIDYVSRLVAAGEVYFVAAAIGQAIGYPAALMISGLSALAVNLLFMLPWELGSREGSLYFLFGLAGVPASVGLVTAVVTRARELSWTAIGMAVAAVA